MIKKPPRCAKTARYFFATGFPGIGQAGDGGSAHVHEVAHAVAIQHHMVGCMIEQGDQSAEHVAEMLTKFA